MLTMEDRFAAGTLLGIAKKNGVHVEAWAITETSTPQVREALVRQLQTGIGLHAQIFSYMLSRGLYPSYHVEQEIQQDFKKNAQTALHMPIQA